MKRFIILVLLIIVQSHGMQQSQAVAASPRTDYAAVKHRLRLLISDKDLEKLVCQMSPLMARLITAKQTTYDGHNNLCILFKLTGQTAHVYKKDIWGNADPQFGSYEGTITHLNLLLQDLYQEKKQAEIRPVD